MGHLFEGLKNQNNYTTSVTYISLSTIIRNYIYLYI